MQFYIDGGWVDVTALEHVRTADSIVIAGGQRSESGDVTYGSCALTLEGASGDYNNRNPMSQYYGLIGRNTPMRVWAGSDLVFHGEVSEWPQRWNVAGTDVTVPIEAAGILRRLSQGAKALHTPLYRAIVTTSPIAYWPLEDGRDVQRSASPIAGVPPIIVEPPIGLSQPAAFLKFNATTGMPGTGNLVDFTGGAQMSAPVPSHPTTTAYRFEIVVGFTDPNPVQSFIDDPVTLLLATFKMSDGTVFRIDHDGTHLLLEYTDPPAFSFTELTPTTVNLYDGRAHHVRVDLAQSGANIAASITIDGVLVATDTYPTHTLAALSSVVLSEGNGAGANRPSINSLAVWAPWAGSVDTAAAAGGWVGETAAGRIERLCNEEGVAFDLVGFAADTALMGPQRADTLVSLLRDGAKVDGGILFETPYMLGLGYRTRESLYNQTPLALDYTAGQIAPPLLPVDDDQTLWNDVTVNRVNGGSARAVQLTGPLSTAAPPDGVGTYDRGPLDVTVQTDAQLADLAAWVKHLGTWDESRYPVIAVNLSAPDVAADPALIANMLVSGLGDLVSIDNPPAWLPPGPIVAMIRGYTLALGPKVAVLRWNATPAGPYTVGALNSSTLGRLDTAGSTTTEDLDTTEAGVDVTSPGAPWSTTAVPYDVAIGGERMTVTSVSGAGPAQTLTVTRSVNGVVKTHDAGAAVSLFQPLRLAH